MDTQNQLCNLATPVYWDHLFYQRTVPDTLYTVTVAIQEISKNINFDPPQLTNPSFGTLQQSITECLSYLIKVDSDPLCSLEYKTTVSYIAKTCLLKKLPTFELHFSENETLVLNALDAQRLRETDYFKSIFDSNYSESKSRVIHLTDIRRSDFQLFLSAIKSRYTPNWLEAQELMNWANALAKVQNVNTENMSLERIVPPPTQLTVLVCTFRFQWKDGVSTSIASVQKAISQLPIDREGLLTTAVLQRYLDHFKIEDTQLTNILGAFWGNCLCSAKDLEAQDEIIEFLKEYKCQHLVLNKNIPNIREVTSLRSITFCPYSEFQPDLSLLAYSPENKSNFKHLSKLTLSKTSVKDDQLIHLNSLPIKVLDIWGCYDITFEGINKLTGHPQLECLCIGFTKTWKLNADQIKVFKSMPALSKLIVDFCTLSDEGREILNREIPKCKIAIYAH